MSYIIKIGRNNQNMSNVKANKFIYYRIWLLLYLFFNIGIIGWLFFHHGVKSFNLYVIPIIGLLILNIYSIFLMILKNQQGFYCLISLEIIFILYSLITRKIHLYLRYVQVNLLFIITTGLLVYTLHDKKKKKIHD